MVAYSFTLLLFFSCNYLPVLAGLNDFYNEETHGSNSKGQRLTTVSPALSSDSQRSSYQTLPQNFLRAPSPRQVSPGQGSHAYRQTSPSFQLQHQYELEQDHLRWKASLRSPAQSSTTGKRRLTPINNAAFYSEIPSREETLQQQEKTSIESPSKYDETSSKPSLQFDTTDESTHHHQPLEDRKPSLESQPSSPSSHHHTGSHQLKAFGSMTELSVDTPRPSSKAVSPADESIMHREPSLSHMLPERQRSTGRR